MARVKSDLKLFTKPRHPHYNWDSLNAKHMARIEARAIDFYSKHWERRAHSGFPSLKQTPHRKERFASVPLPDRPAAEREYERLTNSYISRTGQYPSLQKRASLMANAARYALHILTGKHAKKIRAYNNRKRVWRRLQRERSAALAIENGVPPLISPKRAKSSYNLHGV